MTRSALLLSTLLFSACTVGELKNNNGGGGSGGVDAGGGGGDGGAVGNGCMNRLTPPGPKHLHTAGNTDNAGQNCVTAGCHAKAALGPGAPAFQYGGTVYLPDGTTPSLSAAVTLTGGGKTTTTYTDDGGNFSVMDDGTLPNPFSGNVNVSGCPTIHSMVGLVTQAGCGGSSCHDTGGAGGKITLPAQ